MLAKVACALKSVVATNALVSSRVRGGHAELLRLTASGCSVRVSFTPFFPSLPRSEQPFALKMSTRAASRARGERALCVFMTWMFAAPLSVFAGDDADELIPPGLLPRLPEGLRTALRSVAQQAARAAAVSRLACVSTGVNALAAESSMAAHNRAASNAKLAAISDIFAVALDESILDVPRVQAELVSRCAPGAPLPRGRPDSAASWQFIARNLRRLLTDRALVVRSADQLGPDQQFAAQALRDGNAYFVSVFRGGALLGFFGVTVDAAALLAEVG
jgi:hypothetical protein